MIKKQPEVLVEIIKAKALWREGGSLLLSWLVSLLSSSEKDRMLELKDSSYWVSKQRWNEVSQ